MRSRKQIDLRLYQHKINALMNMAPVAISAGATGALLLFIIYWQTPARSVVSIWFAFYLAIYIVRSTLIWRFNKAQEVKKKHQLGLRLHIAFSVLAGALWSGISIYILTLFSSYETLYVLLILGGLVAGALATNAILISAYFAFVLPATIPVIYLLMVHENAQLGSFAFMLSIYVAFITIGAYRLNKLVSDSISYHFDNLKLLEELEQEKNQVAKLYGNLEFDLARRQMAEEQLKIEKEKAEELAESLIAISTLDGLTGIPNRRHFDSTLAKEWNRASRSQTPISLIMCDIDYFKDYNDHYGHQNGDNCLIQVANLLHEHARRDDDMAARYGGEEFAIILPATNLESAIEIAEQMRQAILELSIRHRFSEIDNIVTMSFGVATIVPQQEQPSRVLVARADKSLYRAKHNGRNRVTALSLEMYDDDLGQGNEITKT